MTSRFKTSPPLLPSLAGGGWDLRPSLEGLRTPGREGKRLLVVSCQQQWCLKGELFPRSWPGLGQKGCPGRPRAGGLGSGSGVSSSCAVIVLLLCPGEAQHADPQQKPAVS